MERDLLLLALTLNLLIGGDTFWFSYRSVTQNKALVYEERNISPLMSPYQGKASSKCTVKIKTSKESSKLNLLNANFYKILPCFYGEKVKVTSRSQTSLDGIRDEVELIIAPVRFIVDFKDDFANITVLK